ncbi:helix-turn-helix domain-containing protein [Nocardiopsis ganjiahuensis]|uniref:helix-turn-helix domain-containing protein n=1 Tax=Nocardiopsis ganjiahuensis TaxID=239984 RepID=UPI000348FDA3
MSSQPEQPLSGLTVQDIEGRPAMTQPEVAALFRVSSHTVSRWIRKGALSPFRTLGGHKRFHTSEILALAGLNHNR